MGPLDILILLSITVGPTKAAAMYLTMTFGADPALKRRIAIRAVGTSAVICGIFALFGAHILNFFHVGTPALLIGGGIILFVFALQLVLGEDHADAPGEAPRAISIDIAAYPLAVPLMASPQGITAITTFSAAAPDLTTRLTLFALVMLQMAINLVFLLSADRIFAKVSPSVLKVVMRIFGLLLCGLAVQLVILGLQKLGVLAVGAH